MREWSHWLRKLVDVEGKYLAIVSMLVSVLGVECVNWMCKLRFASLRNGSVEQCGQWWTSWARTCGGCVVGGGMSWWLLWK
eukprot:4107940-Ditylum_brightwellii.AAC.1